MHAAKIADQASCSVHEVLLSSSGTAAGSALVCGGDPFATDVSLCLFHGPDSSQPFLCEPQSSGAV